MDVEQETTHYRGQSVALTDGQGIPDHVDAPSEQYDGIAHMICDEKAQAHASRPALFVIQPGIAKELTSMMQTWLMNEAACPPAVRQEPDNTLNLLDVDFWLWY